MVASIVKYQLVIFNT